MYSAGHWTPDSSVIDWFCSDGQSYERAVYSDGQHCNRLSKTGWLYSDGQHCNRLSMSPSPVILRPGCHLCRISAKAAIWGSLSPGAFSLSSSVNCRGGKGEGGIG